MVANSDSVLKIVEKGDTPGRLKTATSLWPTTPTKVTSLSALG